MLWIYIQKNFNNMIEQLQTKKLKESIKILLFFIVATSLEIFFIDSIYEIFYFFYTLDYFKKLYFFVWWCRYRCFVYCNYYQQIFRYVIIFYITFCIVQSHYRSIGILFDGDNSKSIWNMFWTFWSLIFFFIFISEYYQIF